jgi:plasmid stabilization system protein ParE
VNPEVEFHPAAEQELLDAEDWYAERSLLAARAFVQEVTVVVESALAAPERWPIHLHGTRRIVFLRFPFSLIYRLREERVQVVAVAHQSRRPDYWKDRV